MPTPADVFNPTWDQGRFIRMYTDSSTDPHLVVDPANEGRVWPPTSNQQLVWYNYSKVQQSGNDTAGQGRGSNWTLYLRETNHSWQHYKLGALLCVKSKRNMQAFFFDRGDEITFQNILSVH